MNYALWKKSVHETRWLLAASGLGIFLFCWARVWLVSLVTMSKFANVVAEFWKDVERFSPVPLDHLLTYPGRIAVTFEELIVILLISVWAIGRGSDTISGELGRGTMEMLLAQPVSRSQILLTQAAVTVAGIAALVFVAWLGIFTGIHLFSVEEAPPAPTFTIPLTRIEIPWSVGDQEPIRVPLATKAKSFQFTAGCINLFALGFFLAGMTTLLSSWDRYRWRTIGIAVGVYIVQIVLKVFGLAHESLRWMSYCTFYVLYEPQAAVYAQIQHPRTWWYPILTNDQGRWQGLSPLGDSLLLVMLGCLAYASALVIFRRRDLPAPL